MPVAVLTQATIEDMDVVKMIAASGGVARRRDLVSAGISGLQLERALSENTIIKPVRGVYALADADQSLLAATCAGADLACINAAKLLGLWILREPTLIHVTVDHGRALDEKFRVHRAVKPLKSLDTCLQCMRCLPQLDALCIVESAVVKKLVTLSDLRGQTGGLRDAALRSIIDLVDPHSQSIIETVARYHLREAGFSVQSQVYVKRVGRLDLFVEGILGIEADGREFHSGPEDFEEDRRRGNVLMISAVPVLRATYPLIVERPEQFIGLVRQGIAANVPAALPPTQRRLSVGLSRQSR